MRNFLIVSAIIFMFSGSVALGFSAEGLDIEGCKENNLEVNTIEKIVSLFNNNAEEKIVQRNFSTVEFQDLVRLYTKDFLDSMAMSVRYCGDDTSHYSYVPGMGQIESEMINYLSVIQGLKKLEKNYTKNDLMQEQSLVLQRHLEKGLFKKMIDEGFHEFSYMVDLGLVVEDYISMAVDLNIDGSGFGNNKGTVNQSSFTIGLDAQVEEGEVKGTIDFDVDMEIRLVDESLYIKVNSIQPSILLENAVGSNLEDIEEMIARVKLLEGKWIEIPFDGIVSQGLSNIDVYDFFYANVDMLSTALDTPWLMQYHTEGDVMYGGINPLACTAISEGISECLDEWLASYNESQGKGFVIMHEYKGSYALGVSDIYTLEKMPEEIAFVNNKPVFRWNDEEITRIELPKNDYGIMRYENGEITVNVEIPSDDYDRETDTVVENNVAIHVNGMLQEEYIDLTMTIMNNDMAMSMDIKTQQKSIGSRTVIAPDESEIVPFDVLF